MTYKSDTAERRRVNVEVRLNDPSEYGVDKLVADEKGWERPTSNGRRVHIGQTVNLPPSELEEGLFLVGQKLPLNEVGENQYEQYEIKSVEKPSNGYFANHIISAVLDSLSSSEADLQSFARSLSYPVDFIAYAEFTGEVVKSEPIDLDKLF